MPSKTKKYSKTLSRLLYSEESKSRRPLPATPPLDTEVGGDNSLSYIEKDSIKYPSLIGKSAFVGRVVNAQLQSSGCKVWLSESSMLASGFTQGAIVSVALASERGNVLNEFPLSSLADECGRQFGVDYGDALTNEAGKYFALVRIFPSSKQKEIEVLKADSYRSFPPDV